MVWNDMVGGQIGFALCPCEPGHAETAKRGFMRYLEVVRHHACPHADFPVYSEHQCSGHVPSPSFHAALHCADQLVRIGTRMAAMLERFADIRSPGGYLRALFAKAKVGTFSCGPMIMALVGARKAA